MRCLVLLPVIGFVLAGCASTAATQQQHSTSVVGYRWRLVRLVDGRGTLTRPVHAHAALLFAADGKFGGDDSVNYSSGRFTLTGSQYRLGRIATTLVGYAGPPSSPTARTVAAMANVLGGRTTVPFTLTGRTLTVHAAARTLTFRRAGPIPASMTTTPSPTPTRGHHP